MFWQKKGWCCQRLKTAFESRHDRGIYIFAEPPGRFGETVSFWLAMRSVREQDVDRINEKSNQVPEVPFTMQTWYPIFFCPWCGVQLEWHYAPQFKILLDPGLSAEHRPF